MSASPILPSPVSNEKAADLLVKLMDGEYKKWSQAGRTAYGWDKSLYFEFARAGGAGDPRVDLENSLRWQAFSTGWTVARWFWSQQVEQ